MVLLNVEFSFEIFRFSLDTWFIGIFYDINYEYQIGYKKTGIIPYERSILYDMHVETILTTLNFPTNSAQS